MDIKKQWDPILIRDSESKRLSIKRNVESDGRDDIVIFSTTQMHHYEKSIIENLGDEGKTTLYSAGYKSGIIITRSAIREWDLSQDEFWRIIPLFTDERGYGWFNIRKIIKSDDLSQFEIHASDCYSTRHVTNIDYPVCYYISGLISGAISELYGHEYYSIETKCEGMGDPQCVFQVKKNI